MYLDLELNISEIRISWAVEESQCNPPLQSPKASVHHFQPNCLTLSNWQFCLPLHTGGALNTANMA